MQVTVAEILADEKRVAVLDALRDRDVTAHDIAQLMGLPASAASYHIKQMVYAGVLIGTRSDDDARVVFYRRLAAPIRAYLNRLQGLFGDAQQCAVHEQADALVLYICRANSARSQMAAAWSRALLPASVHTLSAGVNVRPIHPLTITVMQEVGINLATAQPTALASIAVMPTAVVSVCDSTRLVSEGRFTQSERYHWSTPDPATRNDVQEFRRVRDDLRMRVEDFAQRWIAPDMHA
jgi:protein-tyrosine-phosphatase/DNA-binding MarR family transcriptional regulator